MKKGEILTPSFPMALFHPVPRLSIWSLLFFIGLAGGAAPHSAGAGEIRSPDLLEQGRVLLQARTYHLALDRFLRVEETSANPGERALAFRMIGETQFKDADYGAAY